MNEFPALKQLLQGYLHLDWPEDYDDPWQAVDDFILAEPGHVASLPEEIRRLLEKVSGETELRRAVVEELGSGYLPEVDAWTYESWLTEVARRVSERLPRRRR